MKIDLIAYGIARDIVGGSKLVLDVESMSNVGDLITTLKKKYPEFDRLKSLLIAVNDEYATDDVSIKEGDEIVLIPPVSGG